MGQKHSKNLMYKYRSFFKQICIILPVINLRKTINQKATNFRFFNPLMIKRRLEPINFNLRQLKPKPRNLSEASHGKEMNKENNTPRVINMTKQVPHNNIPISTHIACDSSSTMDIENNATTANLCSQQTLMGFKTNVEFHHDKIINKLLSILDGKSGEIQRKPLVEVNNNLNRPYCRGREMSKSSSEVDLKEFFNNKSKGTSEVSFIDQKLEENYSKNYQYTFENFINKEKVITILFIIK